MFSRADVTGQFAALLPTSGLSAEQVRARLEELTTLALGLSEAVPVGAPTRAGTERDSDPRYATVQVLTAEARILALAESSDDRRYGHVPDVTLQSEPGWAGAEGWSAAAVSVVAGGQVIAAGLDEGQAGAVVRLTGGGEVLSVLTAPAGAGKTATLGAAAAVWQQAGYRVVGLAPSARAAGELANATGGRTDTLAKWLHTHRHPHRTTTADRAWAGLDDRTVVIVDEASMASTLDLDLLTSQAAGVGCKVVLVGDPAQIGVINGPGGLLQALTRSGRSIELEQIHRFTHSWERQASLRLREGDPTVLPLYAQQGRVHPCSDSDSALDGVFTHWTAARAQGLDVLMLARTRLDVDALNLRARAAALATGQTHGVVTTAGGRDWQPGDIVRTRRNHRHLTLHPTKGRSSDPDPESGQLAGDGPGNCDGKDLPAGNGPTGARPAGTGGGAPVAGAGAGHVRNGDRFRVVGPGRDGGLVVQDLSGRGRVTLPSDYLGAHCEYGWASTIDTAQGATADLALVVVRPGMDREHLYVAMTRGRLGNHAYLTPDQAVDPHGSCNHPTPQSRPQVTRGQQPAPSPHPERPNISGSSGGRDVSDRVDRVAPPASLREIETAVGLCDQAMQVLRTVVATSGAQDAAHTALAAAREVAATVARRAAQADAISTAVARSRAEAARAESLDAPQRLLQERPLPVEHQRTVDELAARRARQQELDAQRAELLDSLEQAREKVVALPRWGRRHPRAALEATLGGLERDLTATRREHGTVTEGVTGLTDRVEQQTRARADADAAAAADEEFGRALRLARHASSRRPADPGAGPVLWPPAQPGPLTPRPYRPLEPIQPTPDRTAGRGL